MPPERSAGGSGPKGPEHQDADPYPRGAGSQDVLLRGGRDRGGRRRELHLHPGQTLGIVGESGCGKSVTARSILRIVERPGRIVCGEILLRRPSSGGQREETWTRTARARQPRDAPHPGRGDRARLSGADVVVQPGPHDRHPDGGDDPVHLRSGARSRRASARIELLRQVGIPKPSAAGRIRVPALGRPAPARDDRHRARLQSALLIADEPTTALDVTTQAQILDLLRDLQARTGMAIMLITHNLGVVAEMGDEVVVMYLGRVVERARSTRSSTRRTTLHPGPAALDPVDPGRVRTKLPTISGSIPHPYDRRAGLSLPSALRRVDPGGHAISTSRNSSPADGEEPGRGELSPAPPSARLGGDSGRRPGRRMSEPAPPARRRPWAGRTGPAASTRLPRPTALSLTSERLRKFFPIRRGLLRRHRRPRPGGGRRELRSPAGRDALPRRRERLR